MCRRSSSPAGAVGPEQSTGLAGVECEGDAVDGDQSPGAPNVSRTSTGGVGDLSSIAKKETVDLDPVTASRAVSPGNMSGLSAFRPARSSASLDVRRHR